MGYFGCSLWGLHQASGDLVWNLAAVAMPLLTAVVAAFGKVANNETEEALVAVA